MSRVALPIVLILSSIGFAAFYSRFYPIQEWLFWRYAFYWVACAVWSVGCVSAGHLLVRSLQRQPGPFAETLCMSFATGVVLFYLLINVFGAVGWLNTPTFFALPLAMTFLGAGPLVQLVRNGTSEAREDAFASSIGKPLQRLIQAFGLLVLAMIYFKIISPENVQYDARWQHLALAEEYAHAGFIPRFGEGWTIATNPHLASILYTWAFLIPTRLLFDQIALSAHLEFTVFLWTLATIPPVVRILVRGSNAQTSWVALLLFPGLLLYDSSLAGGADHIAALFALPIFIALVRAIPDLPPGRCALLALMMAGAALTKVTAGLLLVPGAVLTVGGIVVWRTVRERRVSWRGPAVAVGVALAATVFFWGRNWVWYGSPLYPSFHEYLSLRPWTADSANMFEWGYKHHQFWRPERSWGGLWETLSALFTFSFIPHDWGRSHGAVPVFGSLFTLLTLSLPFLRNTRRIWGLVGLTMLSIFIWYSVHHQDRYLQTLLPWMAAVTAATIILIWETNSVSRFAVSVLIVAQILVGADVYFIQSHAMIGSPVKRAADLLAAGYEGRYEERLRILPGWVAVKEVLPDEAHVLVHENHIHLGLSRRTTSDWGTWQYGLSYGRLESPRAVWEQLGDLGVTHIAWKNRVSQGWDSVAGDLVFFDFVTRHAVATKRAGGQQVAEMPEDPPTSQGYGRVAFLGCGDFYTSGLYPLSALTVSAFGPARRDFPAPSVPATEGSEESLLADADYVVVDSECVEPAASKLVSEDFKHVANRPVRDAKRRGRPVQWKLYVRK